MSKNYFTLVAATAAMLSPVEVGAQSADMSHHAGPGTFVTMAEWSKRVQAELQRQMVYPTGPGRETASGMTRITFNCSEDGRPSNVRLLKGSGTASVDRAALRAIGGMASLHPLPTGFAPATRYEALVLFTHDAEDPLDVTVKAEQVRRNAWYRDPPTAVISALPQVARQSALFRHDRN